MNLLYFEGAVESISYIFHNTNMHSILNPIIITVLLIFILYYFYQKTNMNSSNHESLLITVLSNCILSTSNNSIGISDTTKQDLFKKLIEFESSEIYLEKKISLAKLAIHLNTNTKYLSHVIKIHSDRDFNNYINLLRIEYIVNKLNDDTKFRNYKISALADEAGFSSHSKFTQYFKLNLGESPSSYISKLKQTKTKLINRI